MRVAPLSFAFVCVAGVVAARGATPELPDSVDSVADLALEPSFGDGGTVDVVSAAGGRLDSLSFVAIDGAGRIVVAGDRITFGDPAHSSEAHSPGVARFLADGTLDATFGGGGVVALPLVGRVMGMTLGDAGRIVVSGQFQGAQPDTRDTAFGAAALTPDGALDAGFSNDGLLELGDGMDLMRCVHAGPGGTLYAAATAKPGAIGIVRVLVDGRFDPGYAGDGYAEMDWAISDLAVDSSGRVVVANLDGFFGLDADGLLDDAFGEHGRLLGIEGGVLIGSAVEIDAHDRIVVYGQELGHRRGFFRFGKDGKTDPLFAGDGLASRPLGIPGNTNVYEQTFAIAPGDVERYAVVAELSYQDARPMFTDGVGWFFGTFDPARARSVASISHRDPRTPGIVNAAPLRGVAVSADASYAVAVGFTSNGAGSAYPVTPLLVRVDLAHETPHPVANLRPSWSGPVLANTPPRRAPLGYQLSSVLRLRNTGGADVASVSVRLYLTSDAASVEPGDLIHSEEVRAIAAGDEVIVPIQTTWLYPGISRRELRQRRVVAVVDADGFVPQSDTSDDVAVSPAVQVLGKRRAHRHAR